MAGGQLFNRNLLDGLGLLDLFALWEMDVQDSVLHASFNLFLIHIVGQEKGLGELLVGEFATEIPAVLLAFLVLGLLFHSDLEVALIVDMDLEVLLGQARSSELHFVFLFIFYNVDGRGGVVCPFHPAVVEEVVENVRQPAISSSTYR